MDTDSGDVDHYVVVPISSLSSPTDLALSYIKKTHVAFSTQEKQHNYHELIFIVIYVNIFFVECLFYITLIGKSRVRICDYLCSLYIMYNDQFLFQRYLM